MNRFFLLSMMMLSVSAVNAMQFVSAAKSALGLNTAAAVEKISVEKAVSMIKKMRKVHYDWIPESKREKEWECEQGLAMALIQSCADEDGLIEKDILQLIERTIAQEKEVVGGGDGSIAAVSPEEEKKQSQEDEHDVEHKKKLENLLLTFCNKSDYAMVKRMVTKEGFSRDVINNTLLAIPTTSLKDQNRLSMIRLLLFYGADPNAVDERGNNVLQSLLYNDHAMIPLNGDLIIGGGRPISDPSRQPYFMVDVCYLWLIQRITEELMLKGLDIKHRNNDGYTTLDLAANHGTISEESLNDNQTTHCPHQKTLFLYDALVSTITDVVKNQYLPKQRACEVLNQLELPHDIVSLIEGYITAVTWDEVDQGQDANGKIKVAAVVGSKLGAELPVTRLERVKNVIKNSHLGSAMMVGATIFILYIPCVIWNRGIHPWMVSHITKSFIVGFFLAELHDKIRVWKYVFNNR